MARVAQDTQDVWLDDDAGPVVRPYAMTRGRTRPTNGEFDLISLIVATRPPSAVGTGLAPEHVAIIAVCQRPLSVAEIAARVDLPVGIVRVLLGDLLSKELIVAREPQPAGQQHNERIFKAVLNGLRSL
jgi:Protein of unknown function (DUF742)